MRTVAFGGYIRVHIGVFETITTFQGVPLEDYIGIAGYIGNHLKTLMWSFPYSLEILLHEGYE